RDTPGYSASMLIDTALNAKVPFSKCRQQAFTLKTDICTLASGRMTSEPDAAPLPQAGNNDRHIVGLLGSSGPFFRGGHQEFGDMARPGMAHALRRRLQTRDPEFLAIGILGLHEAVAVANHNAIRRHLHDAFHVMVILHDAKHDSTLIQVNGFAVG